MLHFLMDLVLKGAETNPNISFERLTVM